MQEKESILNITKLVHDELTDIPTEFGDADIQKQLERLHQMKREQPYLYSLIDRAAMVDAPFDASKRRSFLRGVLFVSRIIDYVELKESIEEFIDVVDGATRPPGGVPYAGRPTDVLFLAPPDPSHPPEA